jgi:RNA polymerase sigma-70 factor, ECF subfamily
LNDPHRNTGATLASIHGGGPPGDNAGEPGYDDAWLLRQIAQGDQSAMAEFYRLHGRVVFAQILLVVGERPLAEEILQDTMLGVWRGAASFRGESKVRSWVVGIARRKTRDRLRARQLRMVDDAYLAERASSVPGPELVALDRVELAEVTDAIRELPPAHREVLGLAFGVGLSLPEVADVLEIPVGTVKSRLTAARAALSQKLAEKGQNQ